MNKPVGSDMWKDIWVCLQQSEVVLTAFHVSVHKALTPFWPSESWHPHFSTSTYNQPFSKYSRSDTEKEQPQECPGGMACHPWKYNDLVDAVTAAYPGCSKQCPKQGPKESRATYWSSQPVRDRQIGPLPPNEGSKYSLICVDTASGLTGVFSCRHTNQAAPLGD